jgi:hypothetical protein
VSKIYKTVKGKSIDIEKLKLANESTIAVGNMKVNARGDELGAGGKVIAGKNQLADQAYNVPSPPAYSASAPVSQPTAQPQAPASNPAKLNNMIENLTNPAFIPEAPDMPVQPSARGSLADSVAKTTALNQEILKPLNKKPNGPSRI